MTQADEDDEIELSGPGAEDDLGGDVDDIDVETEGDAGEGTDDIAVDEDEDGGDEEGGSAPRGKRAAAAETTAVEDVANIEARRQVREQLESDVEAFLRRGGKIVEVAEDVRADPPKKPESKYGTRSI